jgi:putative hydrolase of the HAD superfamily
MVSKTVVFDLDDTLAPEIEYLKSAFREIAHKVDCQNAKLYAVLWDAYQCNNNPFARVHELYPQYSVDYLLQLYRNHFPNYPENNCKFLLEQLKANGCILGLITDGYSITQRAKLKALGIENLFDLVIISEEFGSAKPTIANYEVFHQFNTTHYYYIADNPSKDFVSPNALGWQTICLEDSGNNIHKQDFNIESLYLPQLKINKLDEIVDQLFPQKFS